MNNDECILCTESLANKNTFTHGGKCTTKICYDCAEKLMKTTHKCPFCRAPDLHEGDLPDPTIVK